MRFHAWDVLVIAVAVEPAELVETPIGLLEPAPERSTFTFASGNSFPE